MFQTFDIQSDSSHSPARLAGLRRLMAGKRLAAYIVPRTDAHQGEYIPAADERLSFLTAFTGSAGTCVVTERRAALFVDGRYTVQAAAEVDPGVVEVVAIAETKPAEWIARELQEGDKVGFDPRLFTVLQIEDLKAKLKKRGITASPVAVNLVDKVWKKEKPRAPASPIVPHDVQFSGRLAAEKIADIQETLKAEKEDALILTTRESIAWAFNLRGGDVAHTPVFSAFAIINQRAKPELFVDRAKLTRQAREALKGVAKTSDYEAFWSKLDALKETGKKVRIDPQTASFEVARRLGGARRIVRGADPCIVARAVKTQTEIDGARAAHLRDGAAVVRFLAWLDEASKAGTVDEIEAATRLEEFRRETNELLEISFDTISGAGENGAIVHYRVNSKTNRKLEPGTLYLVDSGAQYRDGTTDITRTIAIGEPTGEMRDRFTRVLKGHIAVATASFPKGTRGRELDPFARRALWEAGLDFDHGTGHGVGSYLSVHEGPISISRMGNAAFEPGMIVSNEPGYYREGHYGIRIENLVLVKPAAVPPDGERPMLRFETLTRAPIDRRLIEPDLLSADERRWLDEYHARVVEDVGPKLDKRTRAWLEAACAPL